MFTRRYITMFFETWWQGIVFGIVTGVGMLAVCHALAAGWKKYDGTDQKKPNSCDAHH